MHDSKSLGMAFGYLTSNEIDLLKELSRKLPESPIVVNIGAGAGTSGLAFMESREDLFLYTIDITNESSPLGCLEAERDVLSKAGFELNIRNEQIHNDSSVVAKEWTKQIDMVFIDGNKTYEGRKKDVELWLPHLKEGGIIAQHDYDKERVFKGHNQKGQPHFSACLGVDKSVKEMLKDKRIKFYKKADSLISFRRLYV